MTLPPNHLLGDATEYARMSPAKHKERHIMLYLALDELIADYQRNEPGANPKVTPIAAMFLWAQEQAEQPIEVSK